ncbi:MAG: DUF2723 domain-containing protein [Candidatus Omnitrophica bacterium]|nr:hypothetical protein [bacterium]NUN97344.1 DUF2723 domain-containing protein [Candidatus Omnitrophota bacterium]
MTPPSRATRPSRAREDSPRKRRIPSKTLPLAALAFAIPLLVYSLTLAPSVTLEDSAEYASVAKVLGIAHPPGSPTWTLAAHLFGQIPIGEFVTRTNFFSALCVSLAALFLFLFLRDRGWSWEAALAAAGTAAFTRSVWGLAVVTYNYSLNLTLLWACLFFAGRWRRTSDPRWLAGAALAGGLGAGVHHLFLLLSPLVLSWTLWGAWRKALTMRALMLCVPALLIGLAVFLYLPIRAAMNPPIAWGKIETPQDFLDYVSRKVYKEAEGGIWYSGKTVDSLKFLGAFLAGLPREQGGLLVLCALPGALALWRRDRSLSLLLFGMVAFNVPLLLFMGGSQFTPTSEYINRLYYLPALASLAALAAFGWRRTLIFLFRRVRERQTRNRLLPALALCAPMLLVGMNWKACDRSDYLLPKEYLQNLLRSIPPGGAVLPLTNNETFLLLYARHVEGNAKARLMDSRFGWNPGEPTTAVLTAWDVGLGAAHPIPELFPDSVTLPLNILYIALKRDIPEGLERYRLVQKVDYSIKSLPGEYPHLSPFERMIFASYSAYYSALGARMHLEGKTAERDSAWKRSEELNPEDPYCHFLLGHLYELSGSRGKGEIARHYQAAWDRYDEVFDPLDTRFYGVRKETIRAALERLGLSPSV